MKKVLFIGFAGLIGLASCSDDTFVGDQNLLNQNQEGKIGFAMNNPTMTRTTQSGETAANTLGRQFYVYGVKNLGSAYQDVFGNYSVWYNGAKSSSNSEGWEYVGNTATFTAQTGVPRQTSLPGTEQFIKYWDYSSSDYWFNAVSVENNTTTSSENEIYTFTSGSNGQIEYTTVNYVKEDNTIFYADAVKREKSGYANTLANGQTGTSQPVEFLFKRLQSKVRIGIYETVPGYAINNVNFYPANSTLTASQPVGYDVTPAANVTLVTNAVADTDPKLSAGFMPASGQSYKITYNYSDNGKASLTNNTTSLVYGSSKSFGQLNYIVAKDLDGTIGNEYYLGETASTATWATASVTNNATVPVASPYMGSTGSNYWMVLPNESQSASFKIKVDYTLTSLDGSKETIKVTGAEAVVPAEYCKWMGNRAYTYLFKISDNTGGSTGDPTTDPSGLYPITFDACVEDVLDNTDETITLVSVPSITTHADGSDVVTNDEYLSTETIVLTAENYPAGSTFKSWEYNIQDAAITEMEAAFLDATTTLSWTNITETSGEYKIATPTAGKYYIVRLTFAEEFTPASGVEVSTKDYTAADLSTNVGTGITGNGSTKYYHKKYAYKVIKIKA